MQSEKLTGRSLAQRLAAPEHLELPSAHLGLAWRGLEPGDKPQVLALLRQAVDPRIIEETQLVRALDTVEKYSDRIDVITGWDSHGQLQAVGVVSIHPNPLTEAQADIFGTISPQWRGRGIGRALLEWQDGRARQLLLAAGHDLPASIRSRVTLENMDRRRLLAAGGFSPQTRWTSMVLSLNENHAELSQAARERLSARGLQLQPITASMSDELLHLNNRISMVMGRRQPKTPADWQEQLANLDPRSAVLTDGASIVGFALCVGLGEELRVSFYGVERGYRHQGNGTDLVLSLVEPALRAGYRKLSVPVVSRGLPPTQTLTRYGFIEGSSQLLFTIDI